MSHKKPDIIKYQELIEYVGKEMENKFLIAGSAIAVVVLALASLSPVVGYNSASLSIRDSPLFSIRTSRAINEESKDLTCNYFGKGKACTLFIPRRNNQIETVLKVIDSIAKMDDETFEDFLASVIKHIQKDNRFDDVNPDEIREALYQVRDSDTPLRVSDTHTENKNYPLTVTHCASTCWICYITIGNGIEGFLGCILLFPIALIAIIIQIIIEFILWCFPPAVTGIGCQTIGCPHTLQRLL